MPDTFTFDVNGTVTIPNPTVGEPYSHQLPGELGDTFAIEAGFSFPAGLAMDAAGLITGTPTEAGSFPVVRVTRNHAVTSMPIVVNDEPPPPPPPPPPGNFTLTLIGGWRINQPYCYGGLAIDFATMRAWTGGNASNNRRGLFGYQLPAMGSGQDFSAWPQVNPNWDYGSPYDPLPTEAWTYTTGLLWKDGLIWISGKQFYAQSPFSDTRVQKFSLSGEVATLVEQLDFPGRPAQFFGGGFVKGGSEVLVGSGGYESGHGTSCGPCWMRLDGTIVNDFPIFNSPKELREKRPDNYNCIAPSEWFINPDPPVGYWVAGRIYGGGFMVGDTTCFVVQHGIGDLSYSYQGDYFSLNNATDIHLYKYAPGAHFGEYELWPHKQARGFEVNGNHVYMLLDRAWGDAAPVLACFEVN